MAVQCFIFLFVHLNFAPNQNPRNTIWERLLIATLMMETATKYELILTLQWRILFRSSGLGVHPKALRFAGRNVLLLGSKLMLEDTLMGYVARGMGRARQSQEWAPLEPVQLCCSIAIYKIVLVYGIIQFCSTDRSLNEGPNVQEPGVEPKFDTRT